MRRSGARFDDDDPDALVAQLVVLLRLLTGLEIPPSDLPALSAAYAEQRELFAPLLDTPDEHESIMVFDPRWS